MKVKLTHTIRISDKNSEMLRVFYSDGHPKPLPDRELANKVRDTMRDFGIHRVEEIIDRLNFLINNEEVG